MLLFCFVFVQFPTPFFNKLLNRILLGKAFTLKELGYKVLTMTLQQFRASSKYVQQQMIKHQGVFLLERRSLDWDIFLFQVDAFYVEVFYERKTQNAVLFKSFDDTDQLEPYLQRIDVCSIIK